MSTHNIQHAFNGGFVGGLGVTFREIFDADYASVADGVGLIGFVSDDTFTANDVHGVIDVTDPVADNATVIDLQLPTASLSNTDVAVGFDTQSTGFDLVDSDTAIGFELGWDTEKGFTGGPNASHLDEAYVFEVESIEVLFESPGPAAWGDNATAIEGYDLEIFEYDDGEISELESTTATVDTEEQILWIEWDVVRFNPVLDEVASAAETEQIIIIFREQDAGFAIEQEELLRGHGVEEQINIDEQERIFVFESDTVSFDDEGQSEVSFSSVDVGVAVDSELMAVGGERIFGYGDSYRIEVFLDSPLAYWRFNERIGQLAYDQVSDNYGLYFGGVTKNVRGLVAGPDMAIELNGNGHVEFHDVDYLSYENNRFGMELWLSGNAQAGTVLQKNSEYAMFLNDGRLFAESYSQSGDLVYRNSVLLTSRINHIVWSANGEVSFLYINGVLVDETPKTEFDMFNSTSNLIVGNGVIGVIDELAFYPSPLPPERIARHYQVGSNFEDVTNIIFESRPLAYWTMNELPELEYDFSPPPNFSLPNNQHEELSADLMDTGDNEFLTVMSGPLVDESIYSPDEPVPTQLPNDEEFLGPDEPAGEEEVEPEYSESDYQEPEFEYTEHGNPPTIVPVTVVADVTSNGFNADAGPAINFGDFGVLLGKGSTSAHFDGTPDSTVTVPSSAAWSAAPFSVFAWIKPSNLNAIRQFLHTNNWHVQLSTAGRIQIASSSNLNAPVDKTIDPSHWAHVGFTYDGSTVRMYINGELVISGGRTIAQSSSPLTIGGGWLGNIEQVVFYNRVLPPERVQQQYETAWVGGYSLRVSAASLVIVQEIGYDSYTYTPQEVA